MTMTPIEKARLLHEPRGRQTVQDDDLLRWVEALPEARALAEEVQALRRDDRRPFIR